MNFDKIDHNKVFSIAVDLLCDFSICSPATDVFSLLAWYSELHSYECAKRFHANRVPQICEGIRKSRSAFTVIRGNADPISCINEMSTFEDQRFSAAHELGHIVFQHPVLDFEKLLIDNDAEGMIRYCYYESEADCFALVILCPYPVADFFNLTTVEQYQAVFCVSKETAERALRCNKHAYQYIAPYQYNYLSNLMSLYLRGYYHVNEYWKDISNRIFRDVNLKYHPLYSFDNLHIVMDTLKKMQNATPVIQDDSGNLIDLVPFLRMKSSSSCKSNESEWKKPLHSDGLSHPFMRYYENRSAHHESVQI